MEKLMELRRKYAELIKKAKNIRAKADEEKRDLSEEELNQINTILDEADQRAKEIEQEERLLKAEGKLGTQEPPKPEPGQQRGNEPGGEKRFESLGEFLQAVIKADTGRGIDQRLVEVRAASGMNEGSGAEGGFLVQQDFATELIKRTYETGILANRCRKIPISSAANSLKLKGIDEKSRANGSRWGGVQAYWEAEAETVEATKPKFRTMELKLHKLIGLCYATEELLEDAAALESIIQQSFAEEFAFKVDDAIIRGLGSGMPLGILNSGCKVTVNKQGGQAANTILAENIINMWARMWARSRQNAVWLINQDIEPQLYTMYVPVKNVAGNENVGGVPIYLPAGGLSGQPYGTLFGRPVIPIEQCETLGTEGDIILADLSQYLLADKGGIKSAVSIHVRFLYGESTFRFILRIDGQPLWHSALTPYKGSNTLSPFITLQTRG